MYRQSFHHEKAMIKLEKKKEIDKKTGRGRGNRKDWGEERSEVKIG